MNLMSNDSNSLSQLDFTKTLNPVLKGAIPYMAVDPTGGKEMLTKGDMCAMGVGFVERSSVEIKLYMVEARGDRWKSAQQVNELFELATKWRPRQIFIEDNVGKGWLQESIRIHAKSLSMHLPIVWVTASLHGTGKKHERIESLQAPFKYRQILHAACLKGSEYERQIFNWTPEGKGLDDFPDMLALLWLGVNRVGIGTGRIKQVGKRRKPIYVSTQV